MQRGPKASIPYVSVAFFPSWKYNFIAYRSSKVSSRPDCIFEIHQLSQSDFSRLYSNSCCSCSFGREIIKIGQSSHKMYSNKIVNFQESTIILNACTKRVWKHIECTTYLLFWTNPGRCAPQKSSFTAACPPHPLPISQPIQVRRTRYASEIRMNSYVTFSYGLPHMNTPVLADQQRLTYIRSEQKLGAVERTYQEW